MKHFLPSRSCDRRFPLSAISAALSLVMAGASSASPDPEPWVTACKIDCATGIEAHAASISPGVRVEKHGKWLWAPQADGEDGVLIVHPIGAEKPATLALDLSGRASAGNVVRIRTRGSNVLPGVNLRINADGKGLREIKVGKEWQDIQMPLADLPAGTRTLTFAFYPIGWNHEYCYVDEIVIGPAAKPADPDGTDGYRTWTREEGSKPLEAVAVGKRPDNSEVDLMTRDGKVFTVKTSLLVQADRDIVKNWQKTEATPVPPRNPGAGEQKPQAAGGIVTARQSILQQSTGGFGRQIDEWGEIFAHFGVAENDMAAHPEVVIYKGPPMDPSLAAPCVITYLMPLAKAEAKLFKSRGAVSKVKAVGPGFPPGLMILTYDIKLDIYRHLSLLVDGADQVVSLQLKARGVARDAVGPEWLAIGGDLATIDHMNVKFRGKPMVVLTKIKGKRNEKDFFVVNTAVPAISETSTWFVPVPLAKMILFNVREKKTTR